MPQAPGARLTVIECRAPYSLVAEIVQGQTKGRSAYRLSAADSRHTRVEHTLSLELRGLTRLIAPFLRGGLRREHEALRAYIEDRLNQR